MHTGACHTYINRQMARVAAHQGGGDRGNRKGNTMKAFVLACAAMAVIGIGAHFGLASLELSASNVYVTDNVRQ